MAIIRSAPLTSDLSGFIASEAIGAPSFTTPPAQVPGRVEIGTAPDGAACLHTRCYPSDVPIFGGVRSEISMTADSFSTPLWYAWDMWIPSSWPRTGHPYTVMQIHDSPDNGDPVVWPNVEMMVRDTQLLVKVPNDASNKTVAASQDFLTTQVKFDRWVRCAVFADWHKADAGGYVEVYYDGQLVDRRYGIQSAYNHIVGPFLKLGVYDVLHYEDFGMLEAYYRNCVVRDGADGAIAALGATPKAAGRRFAYSLPL